MTDIEELVKRMRGLAEYVDDCEEAADALETQAKEIAEKNARIAELRAALDHMHNGHDALVEYIAELETALKPLAKAWLFPDDLGEEASVIIRCDPDWNEEENDMSREDVIVCRREIRKARAALNGEKG